MKTGDAAAGGRPDRAAAVRTQPGLASLLGEIRRCRLCADRLPRGPRPVLQADARARLLIAGQAPGRRVHETGIPFDDPSGERLRSWTGLSREIFYDPARVAILSVAFCYPGTGPSGDRPPLPACARAWRRQLLARLPAVELTLALGRYAHAHHLAGGRGTGVTETVRGWRDAPADVLPLPHPSPRNNAWLRRHPWFERELLPALRDRLRRLGLVA